MCVDVACFACTAPFYVLYAQRHIFNIYLYAVYRVRQTFSFCTTYTRCAQQKRHALTNTNTSTTTCVKNGFNMADGG